MMLPTFSPQTFLFVFQSFFFHKDDIGLDITNYIYTENIKQNKIQQTEKQQKKVGQRILSIGIRMELRGCLYQIGSGLIVVRVFLWGFFVQSLKNIITKCRSTGTITKHVPVKQVALYIFHRTSSWIGTFLTVSTLINCVYVTLWTLSLWRIHTEDECTFSWAFGHWLSVIITPTSFC